MGIGYRLHKNHPDPMNEHISMRSLDKASPHHITFCSGTLTLRASKESIIIIITSEALVNLPHG